MDSKKKAYDIEFNKKYTKQCSFRLSRITQQDEIRIFESIPDKSAFFKWALHEWERKEKKTMTLREALAPADPLATITVATYYPDGSHDSGTYFDKADALEEPDEVLDAIVEEIGTYKFGNNPTGLYFKCKKA